MNTVKKKITEKTILTILNYILGIISLNAIVILILMFGFYLNQQQIQVITNIIYVTTLLFVLQEFIRTVIDFKQEKSKRVKRKKERILALLLILHFILRDNTIDFLTSVFPNISFIDVTLVYIGITQIVIITSYLINILRNNIFLKKIKIHPGAITAISFATVIIIGSLMLYMPKASHLNNPISFTDAIFTATSAVCVTGLSTVNTATELTETGRIIIIILVQIGGIGVMTLSSFLTAILLGGLSFRMNVMLKDILSENNLGEVTSVLKRISIFTFVFELFGAIFLYFSLERNISTFNIDSFWSAIFHSISAFCNAGFSIYPNGIIEMSIKQNYPFLATIMLLIFCGGIGFVAFSNLFGYILFKRDRINYSTRRLTVSTRLTFIMSFIMAIFGGLFIFATESYNEGWMQTSDKLFYSFFTAISASTAGFATIPPENISNLHALIIMILMFIGASPGSTGGGIKTTTVGVLFLHFVNYLRGRDNLHFAHRRIDPLSIQKAQIALFSTLTVTLFALIILVWLEPKILFLQLAFETVAAVSVSGLTLGITEQLSTASKYVIIILMYVGRIGVLTFLFAFFVQRKRLLYEYPDEKVIVG